MTQPIGVEVRVVEAMDCLHRLAGVLDTVRGPERNRLALLVMRVVERLGDAEGMPTLFEVAGPIGAPRHMTTEPIPVELARLVLDG